MRFGYRARPPNERDCLLKILMVTPHLPPYQAANALLPHVLGVELEKRGHEISFLTFKTNGPERARRVCQATNTSSSHSHPPAP